jgi:hypothetical protein
MPPIEQVPAGSLIYLDCGCHGYRMPSFRDSPVLVIVERPCRMHEHAGRPQLRYVDPLGNVTPFTKNDDLPLA